MCAHLEAMLAHPWAMLTYLHGNVDPSWGYVAPSWGYVGPCWPNVAPSWGYVGPCWPILGLCWPILGAMLAHLGRYVGPCWPILGHKIQKTAKNGKSTKHRKTREFLRYQVGRRQGVQPLSPTERREPPYGKDTARGPLAGSMRLTPDSRAPARPEPVVRVASPSWVLWLLPPSVSPPMLLRRVWLL